MDEAATRVTSGKLQEDDLALEGFLRMRMQIFPQERFDSLVQSLSSAVSRQEWRDLIRRIPELSRS